MNRITRVAAVALAVAMASCSESPVSVGSAAGPGVPLASRSGLSAVSLVVTVANTDGLGNPFGIQNDGQGTYVDGVQYVSAILDASGTFAFNTFAPPKSYHGPAVRWLNYDFSHPVDPNNTFQPGQDHAQNYHFSSGPSLYSPWVALQNLGVNGNPSSECGYMGNSFAANAATVYRVSYHKGNEDTPSTPTAYAVFTRTSVSPAVWTVQPVGSCSPNANVAALRSDDGTVLFGYYTVPFLFTLTAK